MSGLKESDH